MKNSEARKLTNLIATEEFQTKVDHHKKLIILGEKIYGRRKDLKLSQSDLAQRAGTTQRIISEMENGSYAPSNGIGEELYDKLAKALEIDRDYLFSEKIDRRTFELLALIGKKLNWTWDIMQFMKLPYFVDLNSVQDLGFQITNLKYIRYEFGPFDKNIYAYRTLFENKKYKIEFSYINDFIDAIDTTLNALPINDGEKLKKKSYETKPMKKLNATVNGKEGWGKVLDLTSK